MVNRGLLLRLEAKAEMDNEVEGFLRRAQTLAQHETATRAWFGIRFGRSEYGIFDVFPDDASRAAHLDGQIAREMWQLSDRLFTHKPEAQLLDVLAYKIPSAAPAEQVTKGVFLTFKAKEGNEQKVEQFLRQAQPIVLDEPKTVAWFALRLGNETYGIFDVFPDNGGRFSHLTGHVPRELAKQALILLGSMPDIELINIVSAKVC